MINSNLDTRPKKDYEFPDGLSYSFGKERLEIPEILFNPERVIVFF